GELQGHVALPLRLQRGDVDDDAAAGVGALAQAHHQHVTGDAEVLHRARQREAVGRDDALVADHVHEALRVEVLRVDDGGVDVGEDLELARAAHVVAVAGRAVADDAPAVDLLHLSGLERVDHAVLFGHRPDPAVALDAHAVVPWGKARERAIVGGRPGRVYPRLAGPPAAAAGSADRGVRPAGPRSE